MAGPGPQCPCVRWVAPLSPPPLPEQICQQRFELVLAGVTHHLPHPQFDQEGERIANARQHRFLRFLFRRALHNPHQTVVQTVLTAAE